jgi:hypothetical protein
MSDTEIQANDGIRPSIAFSLLPARGNSIVEFEYWWGNRRQESEVTGDKKQ